MSSYEILTARIRDRLSSEWLTPSQKMVWERLRQFDGPPYRVINIYGAEGSGKSFLAWVMEREQYASYSIWGRDYHPSFSRLVLDDAVTEREATRELRPLVDRLKLKQIILVTRSSVDERAMPAFELRINNEDLEHMRANLYRHLRLTAPDEFFANYKAIVEALR
jgi:hypothetical protein